MAPEKGNPAKICESFFACLSGIVSIRNDRFLFFFLFFFAMVGRLVVHTLARFSCFGWNDLIPLNDRSGLREKKNNEAIFKSVSQNFLKKCLWSNRHVRQREDEENKGVVTSIDFHVSDLFICLT